MASGIPNWGIPEYKIEGEDLYLIGTSEHTMIGRFIDQTLDESKMPLTPYCFLRSGMIWACCFSSSTVVWHPDFRLESVFTRFRLWRT